MAEHETFKHDSVSILYEKGKVVLKKTDWQLNPVSIPYGKGDLKYKIRTLL